MSILDCYSTNLLGVGITVVIDALNDATLDKEVLFFHIFDGRSKKSRRGQTNTDTYLEMIVEAFLLMTFPTYM